LLRPSGHLTEQAGSERERQTRNPAQQHADPDEYACGSMLKMTSPCSRSEQGGRPPETGTYVAREVAIPHTHVHRLTRHFLEPAQDILVLTIGLALFGLMVRTIAWLILQILQTHLRFPPGNSRSLVHAGDGRGRAACDQLPQGAPSDSGLHGRARHCCNTTRDRPARCDGSAMAASLRSYRFRPRTGSAAPVWGSALIIRLIWKSRLHKPMSRAFPASTVGRTRLRPLFRLATSYAVLR